MKNMETSSLKILYPTAFHFKEERVLAAHPPSCHPRRVFGNQERERKMRESGGKRKEAGTAPAYFINQKKLSLVTVHRCLYTAPAKQNYKKNQNQKLLQGIKWEKNHKKTKSKNGQNEGTVAGRINSATCENSQPAKFFRLRNFAPREILQVVKFSQSCEIPLLPFFFYFLLLFPYIFFSSFPLVSDLQR